MLQPTVIKPPVHSASNALTERQQTILTFIRGHIATHSYAPTIREIADRCGISSTSVVNYNLVRLEEMGIITRQPISSRTIVLVKDAAE